MKKIYESPVVSFTHVGIEQNLLVLSWDVKGVGGQVSTPIVNEDPSSPVDDKSFAKPYGFNNFSAWDD